MKGIYKAGLVGLATLMTFGYAYRCKGDVFDDLKIAQFRDYEKQVKFSRKTVVPFQNMYFYKQDFDLDGDKKEDMSIMSMILGRDKKGNLMYMQFPCSYWFDKNKNNKVDPGEILMDDDQDGLNGNETWWIDKQIKNKKSLETII